MKVHYLRFGVALVFLMLSVMLFFRDRIAPDFFARFPATNLELGTWLALVLSGWHAARGYMDYLNWRARTTPVRLPLQPNYEGQPYEKNPDFDFIKLPDAEQDEENRRN